MTSLDPEKLKRKTDDGGWFAWFGALFGGADRSHDGSAGVEFTADGSDHGTDSPADGDSGGGDGGGGDGGGD